MIGQGAEALHHAAADHAPAQRAHDLPELDTGRIDLAAALLVARKKLLAGTKASDSLVDLAKAPRVDADPAQILHGVAEMRELPVEHRAHTVGPDDEVAVAEIAMHQRHLLRRTGIVIGQPAQRQFEHRPRPVEGAVLPRDLGDLRCRRHLAQLWQFFTRQCVNTGRDPAELAREPRACLRELGIAQDLARDGLAFDPPHDEAGTEIVLGLKHMQPLRRRQARVMRELHQPRLGLESRRTRGRRAMAFWQPAQDRADIALRMHDIKRPGLLAGAARQPCSTRDTGRAGIPGGDAALKLVLDHFPLIISLCYFPWNLAGRFSRNAVTPSRKSSVAPASRCDWNSRLSWSSKEFSGLSQ